MTGLQKLIELKVYIQEQIQLEQDSPSYHATQRVIAYQRVLLKLNPIVRKLRKLHQEIGALCVADQAGPTQDKDMNWPKIELAALHDAGLHRAVTNVRLGLASREEALTSYALWATEQLQEFSKRELARLMNQSS